jgi:hypothetical protein
MNRRSFFQATIGGLGALVLPNVETLPEPILPSNKIQYMVTGLKPFPPVEVYIHPDVTLENIRGWSGVSTS